MSVLFGGKSQSHDIRDIVSELTEGGASAICNEAVAGTEVSTMEVENMADNIRNIMYEHYSGIVPEAMDEMLKEDAEGVAQMFKMAVHDLSAQRFQQMSRIFHTCIHVGLADFVHELRNHANSDSLHPKVQLLGIVTDSLFHTKVITGIMPRNDSE